MSGTLHDLPRALKRWAGRIAIPVLAGGAVLAMGISFARISKERASEVISRLIDAEAARLKAELAEQISKRKFAIQGLAAIGERTPGIRAADWQVEATRLLVANLQFRAIEWVGPWLEVRWTVPPTSRIPGSSLDSLDDPLRVEQLRRVEDQTAASITRTYVVADGHRQVLICAPMFVGGHGAGFVVGVLRVRDLLDAAMKEGLARGYTVAVYEEPYLIYGASWLGSGGEAVWSRDYDLEMGDHAWRVQVWPSAELLAALRSSGPDAARVGGLLLGILFGFAVYLAQSWRGRARRAEAGASRVAPGEAASASAKAPDPSPQAEATASSAPTPER